ncbi:hypothetical protein Btru_043410 [Bulinus truncatus]|nr:hypothetical protein Btru_043410 [Bulinus truncatus]
MPILNGTDAPEKSWPWQVLLDFPRRYCGGALIDAQWILTAAHCVDDKDEYCTVYFGSRYRDFRDQVQSRSPTLVVLHDEFDNSTLANDIALLKLDSPVDFTEKVRPACLPVYGQEFSLNDRCYITGYGETNNPGPNVLQQLRVHVVPSIECAYLWQLRSVSRDWRDICVGSVRHSGWASYGDSGGPLSCEIENKYYVTGVLSASTPDSVFDLIPDKYVKPTLNINVPRTYLRKICQKLAVLFIGFTRPLATQNLRNSAIMRENFTTRFKINRNMKNKKCHGKTCRRKIPDDVFRKKSNREYNCSGITTNVKFFAVDLIHIHCSRHGHLQRKIRKKKEHALFISLMFPGRQTKQKSKCCSKVEICFQNLPQCASISKGVSSLHHTDLQEDKDVFEKDRDDFVAKKRRQNYDKSKGQISTTTLMEDLLSLKYIHIRHVDVQCYFAVEPSMLNHPTHINGILWKDFRHEIFRLGTFSIYPYTAAKSAIVLAGNGFVYIGSGTDDTVMCYSCCGKKSIWLENENVTQIHGLMSPNCSMVTGRESDNVPINAINNQNVIDSDGSSSREKSEKTKNSLDLETDAAPWISQEHSVQDRAHTTKHTVRKNAEHTLQTDDISSISATYSESNHSSVNSKSNQNNFNRPQFTDVKETSASERSLYQHFTTLEQAHITMPPSVQQPSAPYASATPTPGLLTTTKSIPDPPQIAITSDKSTDPHNTQSSQPQNINTGSSIASQRNEPSSVNTTPQQNASSHQVSVNGSSNANSTKSSGQGPTYSELGIVTERPKRSEYAVKEQRKKTFSSWPRSHHIQVDDLADAGFYYAGYGDCARCFFCGGGLRNWEEEDNVLVEHARWFPKCAYIRQLLGQNFVDAVQELNKTKDKITFEMVKEHMGVASFAFQLDSINNPLKRDPAVKVLVESGCDEIKVLEVAGQIKSQDNPLSADLLLNKYRSMGYPVSVTGDMLKHLQKSPVAADLESMDKVKEVNNCLREQLRCKICMDKDVEVVFLPCGHLVSCAECAGALNDCPVCRKPLKGTVRAFIG